MKLKDILPYCLDFSKKPFNTSFNPLYFWVIGGFTYTIDSFESYCPPKVFDEQIHLSRYNFCNHVEFNKVIEDSKTLTYTDGHIEGQSYLARQILRILYS